MDNKNSILLVDPEFDLNTAADCDLLLKITPDSFSYAIIDKRCRQLKAVYDEQECKNVAETLATRLKNDVYLGLTFNEIKAAVYTENTINIPDEWYSAADLDQYARFFTHHQSDNLYTRPFSDFGFTTIFNLQQFIEDILAASLKNCRLYTQNAPALALAAQQHQTILQLDFTASSFNALYGTGEKLIFQNDYQNDNADEFNYYLLLIISQLSINTTDTEVYLSGIIHADDERYRRIEKYFSKVTFNLPPAKEIDQKILDDMPPHYYSSLLALDLCE